MKKLIMLAFVATTTLLHAEDGTIQFQNSALTRVKLYDPVSGSTVNLPTSIPLVYGVFINGSLNAVLPLGTSSTTTGGLIDAVASYPIPGTTNGEIVAMQIRGWAAEFGTDWQAARAAGTYYGETDVRQVTLGGNAGIWQLASQTNPNRFPPLIVAAGGLHINDITVAEGSNGVVNAVFTVSLPGPKEQTVTVNYATQDGSAVAGQDYVATNGTVTFAPGEVSQTITVAVTADNPPESDEQFSVVLSNPVNASIRKGTGTCLITEASISEIRIDTAIVFHTVAGRHYAVEQSTDLTTWAAVNGAADIIGAGGSMTVYDKSTGCSGVRYYRTRLLAQ